MARPIRLEIEVAVVSAAMFLGACVIAIVLVAALHDVLGAPPSPLTRH